MRSESRRFNCTEQRLRVETNDTVWTCGFAYGEQISIVIKNGEGNFRADEETLQRLEDNNQVVFRYIGNPNGSLNDIAGITNERGNVVGLMPHPEYLDPLTGGSKDGELFFKSVISFLRAKV
jgi:phosphoribosylformylglycinamidine synthase